MPKPEEGRVRWSAERDQIAAALVKFQDAVKAVTKGKTAKVKMNSGGEYSYDYADLADVIEATKAARAAAQLAVVQLPTGDERGIVVVTTVVHSSGQWLEGELSLKPNDSKPQTIGSLITYLRRYSYSAALGICTEADDDGAAASAGGGQQARRPPARPSGASSPRPSGVGTQAAANGAAAPADQPSPELLNEIVEALRRLAWARPHITSWLKKHADVTGLGQLTAAKANEVRGLLETALEEMEREAAKGGAA